MVAYLFGQTLMLGQTILKQYFVKMSPNQAITSRGEAAYLEKWDISVFVLQQNGV